MHTTYSHVHVRHTHRLTSLEEIDAHALTSPEAKPIKAAEDGCTNNGVRLLESF
jgi:hypothetical protein